MSEKVGGSGMQLTVRFKKSQESRESVRGTHLSPHVSCKQDTPQLEPSPLFWST